MLEKNEAIQFNSEKIKAPELIDIEETYIEDYIEYLK